jgi:glycosyltransferase involved in cell wall biosynthesis
MENKSIVILTQYFTPEMGAPQSRLLEMALGLKGYGWDVTVITSMPNYPTGKIFKGYKGKFTCHEKINDIDVYRYWIYASNSRKPFPRIINMISFSVLSLFSIFKTRKLRPAFIITESPPLTLGLAGLILSGFCKAKHLMNVSDIWPLSAYELGALSKGKLYNILESLENYLYKKSYGCLGQSQQIVDHIKGKGISKVCLFRNGVDIKRFGIANDFKYSPGNILKVVYAGLLGVAQGILSLCKNIDFKSLGTEFHIYGSGNEEEALVLFLKEHHDRSIFFHGKLNREQVPAALIQYNITIIPLQKEIFGAVPSKIYESMAAGLPILFSGGGEGAVIIKSYKTGWVCAPSDFDSMKLILQQIVNTPRQEIIAMGEHCKEVAASVFDRSLQIKILNNFLSESRNDTNN